MQNTPTLRFKYGTRDSGLCATEIIFNDRFLREIGYSVDSFVSEVFQEGFPQYYVIIGLI